MLKYFNKDVVNIEIKGLAVNEISNREVAKKPFLPVYDELLYNFKKSKYHNLKEIYEIIWKGSMPEIYSRDYSVPSNYYAKYLQTIMQNSVIKLLQINDEMIFLKFLCAVASQTGKMINYAELAKAADISAPTAKQWIKILESIGIIYLLQPFIPEGAKYIVKAPKLYFCDTGFAAYLTQWSSSAVLECGAMSAAFFETWVIMEIYKSYINSGLRPNIFYLRNFNSKEIELIISKNDVVYPVVINKNDVSNKMIKKFDIIEPLKKDAQISVGECGIICLTDELLHTYENINYIPVWII